MLPFFFLLPLLLFSPSFEGNGKKEGRAAACWDSPLASRKLAVSLQASSEQWTSAGCTHLSLMTGWSPGSSRRPRFPKHNLRPAHEPAWTRSDENPWSWVEDTERTLRAHKVQIALLCTVPSSSPSQQVVRVIYAKHIAMSFLYIISFSASKPSPGRMAKTPQSFWFSRIRAEESAFLTSSWETRILAGPHLWGLS